MVAYISIKKRHLAQILLGLWIILPVLIMLGCGEEKKPPEIIRSIRWMRVEEVGAKQVRKISGVTKAVDETYLSFAVSGTVEEVNVKIGDRVKKKDELAVLDKQPFILSVRDSEAALSKAQAAVVERRANYERTTALYESNNASKAELDEARASFDSARSQVKAAEAQLGLAKRDLRKTVMRAPFNGVISMKQIEPFMEIAAGKAIFAVDGEESGFEVEAGVPEQLVIRLSAGQEADVVFPSLENRKVRGVISEIGSRSATASVYPVKVKLSEQFAELRSGMSVDVAFEYKLTTPSGEVFEKGIKVPLTAVLAGEGEEHFVFIYDEKSSTVKKTPIGGATLRDNDIIVKSGIKPGDILVIAGVEFLTDGQKVKLMQQ